MEPSTDMPLDFSLESIIIRDGVNLFFVCKKAACYDRN